MRVRHRTTHHPRGVKFMRQSLRKTLTMTSATVLLAGLTATVVGSAPAMAVGPDTTFLVLAPQGRSLAAAAARVAAAGGTIVATYDQIGVLVVRSTNPAFDTAIAGDGVEAAAPTTGLGTVLDDDGVVEMVDSDAVAATGNPTGEPLWNLQWDMA